MNVYELLGRSQEQLAIAHQEYINLWTLVHRLQAGEVELKDVVLQVNGEQHSWSIPAPPVEPPVIDTSA